jgi:hypothetical protein
MMSSSITGLSTSASESNPSALQLRTVLATVAALGLLFQVGHFAEHAFQFAVWVLGDLSNICGRDTPWMSPWATALVRLIGFDLFPTADTARRMMLGMEVLHLIGNSIFLTGLVCLYYCVPSKWVRWACYIEAFHLYEHIMLTTSAYFVGKPIGMSTLFGGVNHFGGREFAVGYRVTWHFAMNLLPMPFAMTGLMEHWRQKATSAQGETGFNRLILWWRTRLQQFYDDLRAGSSPYLR